MNLKALQSLVAIYEAESFVEAAKRLNFNQSAVSMQIKALEEELGATLFDRSVRPPAMTPTAVAMVRPAREILALVENIKEMARSPETLSGRLMLGCIPTATVGLLPDGLRAINKRYAGIQVRVQSGLSEPLIESVRSGALDAAIVTEPAALPETLRSRVIMRERLALISAMEDGAPPELDEIPRHPFIRFNRKAGVGRIIDRFLEGKALRPDDFMELDSVGAILAMVERGIGIAIVPEGPLEHHRQRVAMRPLDDLEAHRNVSLVFAGNSGKMSLLDAVLALLRQSATGR